MKMVVENERVITLAARVMGLWLMKLELEQELSLVKMMARVAGHVLGFWPMEMEKGTWLRGIWMVLTNDELELV